ncbi:MAG: hypothetical protein R3F37_16425 [Candidatus Competibacteraceae bacterium]
MPAKRFPWPRKSSGYPVRASACTGGSGVIVVIGMMLVMKQQLQHPQTRARWDTWF